MGLLGKLFSRSSAATPTAPAAAPARAAAPGVTDTPPSQTRTARRLVFDESAAVLDQALASALRGHTDTHLSGLRARFLGVFDTLLQEPHDDTAADFVESHLTTLVAYLARWPEDVTRDVHTALHAAATQAWGEGEGDALTTLFTVYGNASHYDAIILEAVMRAATATFDDALISATTAFPAISTDDVNRLRTLWDPTRWTMQAEWERLHRERFHTVLRSMGSDDTVAPLARATTELFRAYFETKALNVIRIDRWTMLPAVTERCAGQEMAAVAARIDEESLNVMREVAFDNFPISAARLEQVPSLASAYMFAWYDLWGHREDLKTASVEKGRHKYASEIQMLDGDDQFTRYGDVCIDTQWQELFDEVRHFYAAEMMQVELRT
jgi:hypothetical protein